MTIKKKEWCNAIGSVKDLESVNDTKHLYK